MMVVSLAIVLGLILVLLNGVYRSLLLCRCRLRNTTSSLQIPQQSSIILLLSLFKPKPIQSSFSISYILQKSFFFFVVSSKENKIENKGQKCQLHCVLHIHIYLGIKHKSTTQRYFIYLHRPRQLPSSLHLT